MQRTFTKLAILLLASVAAGAHATNVSLSVGGEVAPGVYGRVDIGNTPPPVLYAQPMIITRPVRAVAVQPVYMHVPPGHAKHWSKHCHKYNACAQPVYFVKSAEYERQDDHGHDYGRGHGKGHGKGHRKHDD
ncbi:hypothetical protein [Noviherbaspirillum denitrificans]|uniref:Uncharacterized protein n=1 Tax=Noviherbaspirillum denitrificans TaxID=1968433 RepID=A0A254TDR4_9BURK|nr:hypothetical protein [Noviherbaspirillum denitrificans]OWW20789.1 hypothetical protein AYR66_16235 [Noviherbaspirillum denitrificans]